MLSVRNHYGWDVPSAEQIFAVEALERMVRHAEYLRQISSNRAARYLLLGQVLTSLTVGAASCVTFLSFFGVDRLRVSVPALTETPTATLDLGLNLLTLLFVVLTILSLMFQFTEKRLAHEQAIQRITQFTGPGSDMLSLARAGVIQLDSTQVHQIREKYLLTVSAVPATTDRQFKKARDDYAKKKRKMPNISVVSFPAIGTLGGIEARVRADPFVMNVLRALEAETRHELWLCGGIIRNLIWDEISGYTEATPLDDVDVIYYDSRNTSHRAEDLVGNTLRARISGISWDVRNQARRSSKRPPRNIRDAVSEFPETCTAVALRKVGSSIEFLTPWGVEDLTTMRVRPTSANMKDRVEERVITKRWLSKWPGIKLDL